MESTQWIIWSLVDIPKSATFGFRFNHIETELKTATPHMYNHMKLLQSNVEPPINLKDLPISLLIVSSLHLKVVKYNVGEMVKAGD